MTSATGTVAMAATAELRSETVIDRDAIRANVATLREHAGSAGVMAVVKADAYGHGLVESAKAAVAGGAAWLGVTVLEEALALRAAGVTAPMLSWMGAPGEDWGAAIEAGVDLSANAVWMVDEIVAAARRVGGTVRLQLKADTGLGRGGATPADWPGVVDAALAAQAEGVAQVVGVWSHFAYADAPGHPTTDKQLAVFRDAIATAERMGARPEVRHIANSAATLTRPDAAYDLVRPGLAVYGLSSIPDVATPAQLGLTPAMTVRGTVTLAKRVPAGHGVSYGHIYTTPRETTLALVPLGYAEGIPRHASNTGPVQINGERFTIAGRVCMDQFVVDVGDADVHAGDEVILFGPGTDGEPTAEDWAVAADTISYEIVTRIGGRARRRYVGTPG
jgi:alanine racemase